MATKTTKIGITTANGIDITGIARHGIDRAIERGVKPNAILDALKQPLKQEVLLRISLED